MGEIALLPRGQVSLEFMDDRAKAARGEKAWSKWTGLILTYRWKLS